MAQNINPWDFLSLFGPKYALMGQDQAPPTMQNNSDSERQRLLDIMFNTQAQPVPEEKRNYLAEGLAVLGDAMARTWSPGGGGNALESIREMRERRRKTAQEEAERVAAQKRKRAEIELGFSERDKSSAAKSPEVEMQSRRKMLENAAALGMILTPDQQKSFLLTGDFKIDTPPRPDVITPEEAARMGGMGVVEGLPPEVSGFASQANKARIDKERADAAKSADKERFAGFSTLAALNNAVNVRAAAIQRDSMQPETTRTTSKDPITGQDRITEREILRPQMTWAEAIAMAIAEYPGAEKFLQVPQAPQKKGITLDSVRSKLRGGN